MRRVLVLNHFAKPTTEPGGNRHLDLFGRLSRWDVRIIAADRNHLSESRQRRRRGTPMVFVPTLGGRSTIARLAGWIMYAVSSLIVGCRGQRPHLVYGSSPHLLGALSGYLISRWWRVPFVLEVRDIWPRILIEMGGMSERARVYRLLRLLERFLYRRADRVVHLAAGNAEYLVDEGVARQKLVFIPNSTAATSTTVTKQAARDEHQLDGVVAVYTGSHGQANHLELLLNAAKRLESEFPSLVVVLVGDGAQKKSLQAIVADQGIGNVHFRPPVPKRDLASMYVAADFGVHVLRDVPLFRHGVSPNKVMDYMAAGLPVVTNSPGEVGDLIVEAGAGVVVEPDRLAEGLAEMAAMSERTRRRLGENGRSFVEGNRNPDLMAERLEAALDSVVASAQ